MALSAAAERTNEGTIILTLGFSGWLGIARLIRSRVLELRHRDFITAARAFGQSTFRIFLLHLLPNVFGTVIVTGTLAAGQMIVAEAALSWLGAGLSPPEPSWGRMLAEGQEVFPASPWLLLAPVVMLVASSLGFNLLGEGLRDRFEEKRQGGDGGDAEPTKTGASRA
jgi:peptide/nickel transport system permease protein